MSPGIKNSVSFIILFLLNLFILYLSKVVNKHIHKKDEVKPKAERMPRKTKKAMN
jgi:hypothetical protein